MAAQLAALTVPPGSLPWLHTLEQPALVLAGDDDPILPLVNSLMLAHRIPRARLLERAARATCCCSTPTAPAIR